MTEGVPTTTIDAGSLRPPPLWQLPLEALSLLECVLGIVAMPVLMRASRGDGHPVLVLPGLLAADGSTALLRWYLARLGYRPFGWELGRNVKSIGNSEPKLRARLAEVGERSGGKVSLVGWSLGGVLARLLARAMPDHVRRVITLGSPCSTLFATNAAKVYARASGEHLNDISLEVRREVAGDLSVPATSIYSRLDAVVAWRSSVITESERAENIEVPASHIGLGFNPAVLWTVADRLAQADGEFTPFARGGPFRFAHPRRIGAVAVRSHQIGT